MEVAFRRIAIVGVGLLGGSLGMALRKRDATVHVRGVGRSRERLELARRVGAIDDFSLEISGALADRDLVVLATPIEQILSAIGNLGPLAPGAVVTDLGSTKRAICSRARQVLSPGVEFVGGHPLAGKEVTGVEHADAELFAGAPWVLCAEPGPPVERMAALIESVGARVVRLSPEEHDRAAAWISHLPQLLSTALANVAQGAEVPKGTLLAIAGSGFRDMARLAGSAYAVWKGILETNGDNIADALAAFGAELEQVRGALSGTGLEQRFERARRLYEASRTK
jgi:prephenate dehydrogenase